jgi:hypothetical protein
MWKVVRFIRGYLQGSENGLLVTIVYNPWQPKVCWKYFFFRSGSEIVFSIQEVILLSSKPQNIQVIYILE